MVGFNAVLSESGNGAVAAPVLAAMITSSACSEICSYAKKMEEEKKTNDEIRIIAANATAAIQQQQEELHRLFLLSFLATVFGRGFPNVWGAVYAPILGDTQTQRSCFCLYI